MNRTIVQGVVLLLLAGAWTESRAAPPYIPVQGLLADSDGLPLEGTYIVGFSLYLTSSGGTSQWSETQEVLVSQGLFTAYLGTLTPLPLSLFRDQDDLWLGIQVESDSQMERIPLGSSPFAGEAEYCSNLPDHTHDLPEGVPVGEQSCSGTQKVTGIDASGDLTCDVNLQSTGGLIPSGAVMAFDLATCPPGWSEFQAGRGRYLVGSNVAGQVGLTVGTALSDGENRKTGTHLHPANPPAALTSHSGEHNHGIEVWSNWEDPSPSYDAVSPVTERQSLLNTIPSNSAGQHNHAIDPDPFDTGPAGQVDGTNAPYVQLLMCVKD